MLKKLLIAAVLATAPAGAALAHDYDGEPNWSHREDHQEHRDVHRDIRQDHQDAHEDGFYSRGDHRAYHRALKREHRDFHDYHPGTRHGNDRYRRYGYDRYRGGW